VAWNDGRGTGTGRLSLPIWRRFAMYRAFWPLCRGLASIPVIAFSREHGDSA
jgi:hypothetical protein